MLVIYYSYLDHLPGEKPGAYERRQHAAGRKLLFYGLSQLAEPTASSKERADISPALSYSDAGKPFLPDHPDIHFSISHCDGLVLCAFHTADIGADAEKTGYFPEVLPSRVFTVEEQQLMSTLGHTPALREEWFYRLWTLKEAYVKMTGTGLDTDLKAFSFSFREEGQGMIPCCSAAHIACFQTLLPSGHIISLCCKDPAEQIKLIEIT